jgi:hypothetical protein
MALNMKVVILPAIHQLMFADVLLSGICDADLGEGVSVSMPLRERNGPDILLNPMLEKSRPLALITSFLII